MQELKFWKAEGLEQVWGCTIFLPKAKRMQNSARMANGAHAAPLPRIFSQPDCLRRMYMVCMVGSGNGASKWAEKLIGHAWGVPVVGTSSSVS